MPGGFQPIHVVVNGLFSGPVVRRQVFKHPSLRRSAFPLFSALVESFCTKRRLRDHRRSPGPRAPRLRLFPTPADFWDQSLRNTLGVSSRSGHFPELPALRVAVGPSSSWPRTLTAVCCVLAQGGHGPSVALGSLGRASCGGDQGPGGAARPRSPPVPMQTPNGLGCVPFLRRGPVACIDFQTASMSLERARNTPLPRAGVGFQ